MVNVASLAIRAKALADIRSFFAERQVLEVETPVLGRGGNTDPHIDSFLTALEHSHGQSGWLYLQTSPEFAMKRLVAAGSGSIYQICKAFRNGDVGSYHHPEFTMLEWYRVGYSYHELMIEVDALVMMLLNTRPAQKITYAEAFERYLSLAVFEADVSTLKAKAEQQGIREIVGMDSAPLDAWRDLLLTHAVVPHLGVTRPTFVYDYPASQAALACIRDDNIAIAERFELYINGVEIANGYQELSGREAHLTRFLAESHIRKKNSQNAIVFDEEFLQAIEGLPFCAGVALGLDRLLMVMGGGNRLADVLGVPLEYL